MLQKNEKEQIYNICLFTPSSLTALLILTLVIWQYPNLSIQNIIIMYAIFVIIYLFFILCFGQQITLDKDTIKIQTLWGILFRKKPIGIRYQDIQEIQEVRLPKLTNILQLITKNGRRYAIYIRFVKNYDDLKDRLTREIRCLLFPPSYKKSEISTAPLNISHHPLTLSIRSINSSISLFFLKGFMANRGEKLSSFPNSVSCLTLIVTLGGFIRWQ